MKVVRRLAVLAAFAVVVAACGGGSSAPSAPSPAPSTAPPAASPSSQELSVAPASFDLAVGSDQRFLAGVFTPERGLVVGGEVEMSFFYLGTDQQSQEQELVETTTGSFLSVPGMDVERPTEGPRLSQVGTASGVYETTVSFDRAGFWGVALTADVDGEPLRGTGVFEVAETHQVPTVGDEAPRSENPTVESDVPPIAVDSRATGDDMAEVPDPELHDTTVAAALEAQRPTVVALTTPVYCVSRFCGPITDTVQQLQGEYGDRAEFIHIEVWRDFEANELNDATAEWIQTAQGGNEPWVFLVDGTGVIQGRWDNVLDEAELRRMLDDLPT